MQARLPLSFDASPNRATFGRLSVNARAPMQSPTSMAVTNGSGDRAPFRHPNRSPCDAPDPPSDKLRRSRPSLSSPRLAGEDALSLHRFQRLQSVLCRPYPAGASRRLKPLRLTKTAPLDTCRSSPRGLPVGLGKERLKARHPGVGRPEKTGHVHRSFFEPRSTLQT